MSDPKPNKLKRVSLKQFLQVRPAGEASRMAEAVGIHKSTVSSLANRYVPKRGPNAGRPFQCSGRVAGKIRDYGREHGFEIDVDPLCGLQEA